MLPENKKIAIIGAGPGGLTLARLLQLKGLDVTIYERDLSKEARVQGSPLDMHEGSGAEALHKAGLWETFEKSVKTGADKKIITDGNANIIFSDHGTKADEETKPAPPEIDRGKLRRLFLESLQPGTVLWDSHFISMEKQNDGWLLHFKNGELVYADLVIGADGANSKIRPYVTPIKAFYSGFTMLEINVHDAKKTAPHIYAMLNGGKLMAFGNEKCLLGGQKGEGDLGFYASFKPDENWSTANGWDYADKPQLLTWFKKEYCDWSPVWYELLENATKPVIPRPIYCMPLDQTWEALPNVTLLGDAAHVMPPFAGEGANTSMLDAVVLSECLTSDNFSTLQNAISFYETEMRTRAAAAAKRSLENGERMHSNGALEKMLIVFGIK